MPRFQNHTPASSPIQSWLLKDHPKVLEPRMVYRTLDQWLHIFLDPNRHIQIHSLKIVELSLFFLLQEHSHPVRCVEASSTCPLHNRLHGPNPFEQQGSQGAVHFVSRV